MKKLALFLFALSLVISVTARAGDAIPTSGDYLSYCRESMKVYEGKPAARLAASTCLGFVEGSIGMHAVFIISGKGTPFYCMPGSGISGFDAISIWVNYLRNHQEKLGNSPEIKFILAMGETYPCGEDTLPE